MRILIVCIFCFTVLSAGAQSFVNPTVTFPGSVEGKIDGGGLVTAKELTLDNADSCRIVSFKCSVIKMLESKVIVSTAESNLISDAMRKVFDEVIPGEKVFFHDIVIKDAEGNEIRVKPIKLYVI